MAKIETFEELECWKAARELVKNIYDVTRDGLFSKDFGLRDQIRRSAVSIMANIAEGFGTYSNSEFVQFLNYSARSCCEVQSHAYVALDATYIGEAEFHRLYEKAKDCHNLVRGFIRYLKSR